MNSFMFLINFLIKYPSTINNILLVEYNLIAFHSNLLIHFPSFNIYIPPNVQK